MSWTRAPGTGRPSASVTTPRTTTARAGVGKIRSAAKIRESCAKRPKTIVRARGRRRARKTLAGEMRPMSGRRLRTWVNSYAPPGSAVGCTRRNRSPDLRGCMTAKDWIFPSRRLAASVGGSWLAFTPLRAGWSRRARSQLRGSGGVSPRFPNIPLRARVEGGASGKVQGHPPDKGVTQVVCDRAVDVKSNASCASRRVRPESTAACYRWRERRSRKREAR